MRSPICFALALPLILPILHIAEATPQAIRSAPVESRILRAVTQARLAASETAGNGSEAPPDRMPLEPKKEVQRPRKLRFFRTRAGATALIIASSIVAGEIARRTIED